MADDNLELLPCPFCNGSNADPVGALNFITDIGGKWGCVQCGCGACGPDVRTGYKMTGWEAEAAKEWNRRAPPLG